jgi:LAO/AO transport system kinase
LTGGLAASVAAGDPIALARAISLVEAGDPAGEAVLGGVFARTGAAAIVGVTGPPGVGKSTLVSRLIASYRGADRCVGVVAVDPTSAFSGGAILGDRVRMQEHALDPGVFIRSMASRGRSGGLSRATRDAVDLLDAAGRDPVLIETVGVGQDEVDVVRVADTVLVVLTPGQGDDIQAIKAGILEIADLFVVNKADHEGADRLTSDLEAMLSLGESRPWRPPVLQTIASEGVGIEELIAAIARHRSFLQEGERLAARRRAGIAERLLEIVRERLVEGLMAGAMAGNEVTDCARRIEARSLDPYSAARQLLAARRRVAGPGGAAVLDHIGVAVRSIDERIGIYRDRLGLPLEGIEEVPGEGVRVAMLPAGRTRIELVEPAGRESAVGRFLDRRGEGIHHVCFEVEDFEGTVRRFREAGFETAGAEGRPGAEGSRVAFLHPRGTGGVLLELRGRKAEG